MYAYTWDPETGGLLLNSTHQQFSKEPRPVYYRELDILGFNKYFDYDKNDSAPIMWAEANNYIYKGKVIAQVTGGTFFQKPQIKIIDAEFKQKKLKPVDIKAMVSKNKNIIEGLASETIKKVYNTFIKYKNIVDIFHVSFSGGKDSEVTLDIVQRALPHDSFVVVFGDTGMEFPDTYKAIDFTKKECEKRSIKFFVARSKFKPTESWRKFGPPTSTIRWCCSVHKTTPQLLTLRRLLNKTSFTEMAFVGVRADESLRRSGYDYVSYGTKHKGQYSCNPILHWNSAEVYLYLYSNNLRINDAYKHGNTRAGCLVCPMSTNRNDYFNNTFYKEQTTELLDIIREDNSTYSHSPKELQSYVENNGWKARKNGRDLNIAPKDYSESVVQGKLTIHFKNRNDAWRQWIKTLGEIMPSENPNTVRIKNQGKVYSIAVIPVGESGAYSQATIENDTTNSGTLFMKNVRKVFRKSHYCVGCRVCEANCKFGNLSFEDNSIRISNNCTRCGQCLNIDTGCYVYKSLWLSKGLGKNMKQKSLDCYAAHGPKMEWFQQYIQLGEKFKTENTLGNNQIPAFNRFLRDAGVIDGDVQTELGNMLMRNGLQEEGLWALMLANLAQTPEIGWFISHFDFNTPIPQSSMVNILISTDGVSNSAQKSIPSALKRVSLLPFNKVGFGTSSKASKEMGGYCFERTSWRNPNPEVILYSLYRFAEACGDYYRFTLTDLANTNVDRDGVSPMQIFGICKDDMKKIITGLSTNYPDYISSSFTLGLDNINLHDDKTSKDVLNLLKK